MGVVAVSPACRAALPLRLTSNAASVGLRRALILTEEVRCNLLCTHGKVLCTLLQTQLL